MESNESRPFSTSPKIGESPRRNKAHPEDQPIQFGLRTLFVLQAICAIFSAAVPLPGRLLRWPSAWRPR